MDCEDWKGKVLIPVKERREYRLSHNADTVARRSVD